MRSTNKPAKFFGNESRMKASRLKNVISKQRMRTPRLQPTAASSWHGSDRKVSMLTTSTDVFFGRLIWAASMLALTTFPRFEWGSASSPIIWKDLVILQCDTQTDSFIMALNANTGKTVWKTDRDEIPSWGTPTVVTTSKGEELVANASNFIRGYDPRTGKELWRLGKSSKITAPTPIFARRHTRRGERSWTRTTDIRR